MDDRAEFFRQRMSLHLARQQELERSLARQAIRVKFSPPRPTPAAIVPLPSHLKAEVLARLNARERS
ncbi:MAG: hypothetical protein BGO51_24365 [Rhodospirillales bacterium 69-11]|jgi:hypothetical protein|nr:hypothetical protein [Rhodospirillales bacterium]OJW33045.1 MAG: hypothetical protein BGO51_24365 [Rhodospirillales bacterium 69-11]